MAKRKGSSRIRRLGRKIKHRAKAKPSIALLGGMAVGPAQIAFGNKNWGEPIWKRSDWQTELWDRVSIAYVGYKLSDGSKHGLGESGFVGTLGIAAGAAGHWLANLTGVNRYLARMKMPFRI